MEKTFNELTTEQKAKVESLEIAEYSLLQLAQDMQGILLHKYCKDEMSAASRAKLLQASVDVLMERERMLGDIIAIKRG